jgi:UDP-N-acetylmuramoyl-L-alanyl-D-glutamate--2,6-diaminopimelate ligase
MRSACWNAGLTDGIPSDPGSVGQKKTVPKRQQIMQIKDSPSLRQLVNVLPAKQVSGDLDLKIKKIEYDSRRIKPGDLFVAMSGFSEDGYHYIHSAVERGAVAVVAEKEGDCRSRAKVLVPDAREALALLSSRFYGYPSRKLTLVGITGTNGKTTISYLTRSILQAADNKVGLIGTIAYWLNQEKIASKNTTPESLDLQRMFYHMLRQKISAAVMEVSSHALALHRVDGTEFDVAVFTNLNHEHLDFHKTMDAYRSAKGLLFKKLKGKDSCAVINMDDPSWRYFSQLVQTRCLTYSLNDPNADFFTTNFICTAEKSIIDVSTPSGELKLEFKLIGESNIYNALAGVAAGFALGVDPQTVKCGLEAVPGVPGRMERIQAGQDFNIWIDYAHTPHAFERLLKTARRLTKGRLLLLFGCGGDRDQGKRPLMGKVAADLADIVFLTEDNPRSEDPQAIVQQIMYGMEDKSKARVIIDRKEGIREALETAKEGDTLILAGKGHEEYQVIGHDKVRFSDRETLLELLPGPAVPGVEAIEDDSRAGHGCGP